MSTWSKEQIVYLIAEIAAEYKTFKQESVGHLLCR